MYIFHVSNLDMHYTHVHKTFHLFKFLFSDVMKKLFGNNLLIFVIIDDASTSTSAQRENKIEYYMRIYSQLQK